MPMSNNKCHDEYYSEEELEERRGVVKNLACQVLASELPLNKVPLIYMSDVVDLVILRVTKIAVLKAFIESRKEQNSTHHCRVTRRDSSVDCDE